MKSLKILDLAVAIVFLAYGLFLLSGEMPSPSWTAILLVVGGIVGIPMSFLDLPSRARKLTFRSMVKKRV